jgi:hypothetical protein
MSGAHYNYDDATIIASNKMRKQSPNSHHSLGMLVEPSLAIADTGATSFFLTQGAPSQNKGQAVNPITVTLPDGKNQVHTHMRHCRSRATYCTHGTHHA